MVGNESVKPTDEFRNGEFFGKNNAGVDASGFVPLLGELEKVFVVEREDRSSVARAIVLHQNNPNSQRLVS